LEENRAKRGGFFGLNPAFLVLKISI